MRGKKESTLTIMLRLYSLIKSASFIMLLGIILGILSHLSAIGLMILGAEGIAIGVQSYINPILARNLSHFWGLLIALAILRALFNYGAQYCKEYINLKTRAIVRHRVFDKMRILCPAWLELNEKDKLITSLNSDIEQLEVFYAGIVYPIATAAVVSIITSIFIGMQYLAAGIIAAIAYVVIGGMIPSSNEIDYVDASKGYKKSFGKMNAFILGALFGIDEIIQFNKGDVTLAKLSRNSDRLTEAKEELLDYEKKQKLLTGLSTQAFSLIVLAVMLLAYSRGRVSFEQLLLPSTAMMSSFKAVFDLAGLFENINQTMASSLRIFDFLCEEAETEDINDGIELEMIENVKGNLVTVNNVSFSHENMEAVKEESLTIAKGKILVINDSSISGKSSFLRLLMRYWDVDSGQIHYYDKEYGAITLDYINTNSLRKNIAFVGQQTWISQGTIAENIAMGAAGATMNQITEVAQKVGIHDFITKLPHGYDTLTSEIGFSLSEGQKQRIGLARAFLSDASLILMDDPTGSLDALNQGIILKSIKEEAGEKTIVIASNRKATMAIAD